MGLTRVTYAMIEGAVVNVLDYGAVGDGSTDDTAAIQAALDAGSNTVYLPAGTYRVSDSIAVNSNTKLCVAGVGITTIKPFATPYNFVFIQNYMASVVTGTTLDTNIEICELTINGLSTGLTNDSNRAFGIELYGINGAYIHDVEIKNMPLSAIEIVGDKAASARGVYNAPYGLS